MSPDATGGPERSRPAAWSAASLSRRLSVLLLGPLVVAAAIFGVIGYFVGVDAATRAYDGALLDSALAISRYVEAPPPGGDAAGGREFPALPGDSAEERLVYEVVDNAGRSTRGNAVIAAPPHPPAPGAPVFYDATLDGRAIRAVAIVTGRAAELSVRVAESRTRRNVLVREVLGAIVIPEVIIVVCAAVMLGFGIRRGLAPLDRLRNEIAQRTPSDLHPMESAGTPLEVRPLVEALNALLARLSRAISSQQQFIGNAAHQLRTPLAGLSAHTELALRTDDPSEVRRLMQAVLAETQRAAHLVNQLLALARVDPSSASHAGAASLVNLESVIDQAATDWVRQAMAKRVDIGFELTPAWINGHPLLLRELATNLVENAIAYTGDGGRVTVSTGVEDGEAVLQVEDDGPGIAQAERARVFERFYRVPGTSGHGCGLGLSIVRDIARRHGGTVSIDDARTHHGTLVSARFPLAPPPGRSEDRRPGERRGEDRNGDDRPGERTAEERRSRDDMPALAGSGSARAARDAAPAGRAG